jgi:hypothetical protein
VDEPNSSSPMVISIDRRFNSNKGWRLLSSHCISGIARKVKAC